MNAHCYKIVFSKRLGSLVAVGEHTTGQGKAAGNGVRTVVFPSSVAVSANDFVGLLKSAFASVALSFVTVGVATAAGPAVNTLPIGYSVNSGNVAISSTSSATNATMTITQATDKASVNWNSFNIGSAARVNVQQNSASSVLLNRVVGNDPSQIFGKLSANGQVILINPNGIVFGSGGSVSASAFTASTFGVSEQDFASGKYKYNRSASTAGITVEEGATLNATAPGGYIALIGASVDNQGRISTQQGAVVMAAGESIALPAGLTDNISVPLSGKVRLELRPSTINAMVSNSGTITTEGGQVLMQAAALSDAVASVTHTGTIDTTGAQGGAVSLLADHGIIKVSGSIKASSTGASNKGGDIVIGRDTESGVLAKSTDVSGAKLESQGGFVETSAHQLTVDGATVKAANWLLDPDNIDITGDATAATAGYSKIKASDIATALNAGTSVTISTTSGVTPPGTIVYTASNAGDGNILVNAAIVKSGINNASLALTADNGVTINQRIGKASGDTTSTGKLDVTMTASGNAATVTNRSGLTLNSVIDAGDGNVTLTGTNSNTNGGSRGVNFNNGSGITANTITVTGTATGAAEWNQGVLFSGTSSFKSTGSSVITGISSSTAGAINSAVVFNDGSNVTLDAGAGSLTVQGTHTVNGYGGIRFGTYGGSSTNPSLTTKGNVTLGTQDASNTSLNAGFMLRGGLITADTGSLTIKGQATGTGINLYDGYGTIKSNGGAITLNGVATTSGHGVYFNSNQVGTLNSGGDVTIIGSGKGGNQGVQFNGGNVRIYGNNVTINGTANTASGQTGYGFYSSIGPFVGNSITAAGNLAITGTLNGAGSGTAVAHTTTSWQNLVNAYTAGGTLNINGTNNASTANTSATITMAGVQASAGGDLTVSATTNNAATEAIAVFSNSYSSGVPAPGYQGGASSFVSTGGNTTLKSNQGSIFIQDGVPNTVTSTAITGKNVIIDNTGGTFTGGVFTAGSGASTSSTRAGVQISDSLAANDLYLASNATRRTITASDTNGQIVLSGKSTGSASGYSVGVRIAGTTSFVAPTTNLLGTSTASVGVYNTAAITTSKDLNITGVSTSQSNTQGGVTLNASITTGSTGKVDITSTDTAGGSNWAYNQNSAANINAGSGGVTINATGSGSNSALNILGNITTTGAVSLTGNAGTGGGNGIYTSGTVGISGTSVTMNGTGGTTGGSGVNFNGVTNLTGNSLIKGTASSANGIQIGSAITAVSGDISLEGTSSSGNGISIDAGKSVTSTAGKITFKGAAVGVNGTGLNIGYNANITTSGNVELTGTTDANNRPSSGAFAGVYNAGTVSAKNITLNALATNTSADVLGYYGAGRTGNLIANNTLTATAESKGNGAGFYMIEGKVQSGSGMSVTGLSNTGSGIGLDSGSTVSNSVTSGTATGSIVLTGSKNSTSANAAIFLLKANISNSASNGGVQLTASKGDISSKYGSANTTTITNNGSGSVSLSAGSTSSTEASAINGTNMTITQNGNGGVQVTTSGTGDVTAPKIINAGNGDVVVAAGTAIAAGTGAGGQVKTVTGNTITQSSTGKTYIYTGSVASTGSLSNLTSNLTNLNLSSFSSAASDKANTVSRVAYTTNNAAAISDANGGGTAQVFFREAIGLAVDLGASTVNKTYGDVSKTIVDGGNLTADVRSQMKANNTITETISNTVTGAATSVKIKTVDLIDALDIAPTTAFSASSYSTSNNLKANTTGYGYSVTSGNTYNVSLGTTSANVVVEKKAITLTGAAASEKVYDRTDTATLTSAGALTAGASNSTDSKYYTGDTVSTTNTGAKFTDGKNVKFDSSGGVIAQGVTIQGLALDGADKNNYTVTDASSVTAKITQKSLTALYVANDKVYNGNTNATVTGTLKDIVTGDAVIATHTSATFDTAAVGTDKTVTVAGIALAGKDESNYKVNAVATTKANVTAVTPPPPSPVVPSSAAPQVKIPVGSANPFSLASVEEMDDDVCSANGIENFESCQCEEAQGVSICYEPAASAGRASH